MFGILGCGSSKKAAIFAASKSGLFAIVANGGASLVAPRWFDTTTWQGAHHRRASRSPLSGSAPNATPDPAVAAIKIAKLKPQPRILPPRTADSPSARAPQAAQQPPRRKAASVMSAARPLFPRKRASMRDLAMSRMCHVWTAPSWQELSSRLQHWSVQPCVRPLDAVHMTAGHNALRGSGPGQKLAFDNAVAHVGCPDRRIDRLCITCCSLLPTFTSRRMPGAISFTPQARRVPCNARPWPSSPRPSGRACWRARWRRPWSVAAPTVP